MIRDHLLGWKDIGDSQVKSLWDFPLQSEIEVVWVETSLLNWFSIAQGWRRYSCNKGAYCRSCFER
jgi:hypothetical protein